MRQSAAGPPPQASIIRFSSDRMSLSRAIFPPPVASDCAQPPSAASHDIVRTFGQCQKLANVLHAKAKVAGVADRNVTDVPRPRRNGAAYLVRRGEGTRPFLAQDKRPNRWILTPVSRASLPMLTLAIPTSSLNLKWLESLSCKRRKEKRI